MIHDVIVANTREASDRDAEPDGDLPLPDLAPSEGSQGLQARKLFERHDVERLHWGLLAQGGDISPWRGWGHLYLAPIYKRAAYCLTPVSGVLSPNLAPLVRQERSHMNCRRFVGVLGWVSLPCRSAFAERSAGVSS